jgi:signal peptidase
MVGPNPDRKPRARSFERRTYSEVRRRGKPVEEEEVTEETPRWRKEARSFLFDIMAAFIVLLLLVGGLYTYTNNWPPLVVVQSGSMQHSDDTSFVGVIDTGDLVFVKKVEEQKDIVPYYDGVEKDHRRYDSYGDVIIFRPNGDEDRTAIIHRAVLYIEFNSTDLDWENESYGGFDIPALDRTNEKEKITIEDYEWPDSVRSSGLTIDLGEILRNFYTYKTPPHGGYITKGDDNPGVDQTSDFYSNDPPWIEPVEQDWVIGKSVGELPWFGIIKLKIEGNDNWPDNSMRNLIIAMVVLVATPFILDIGIHMAVRAFKKEEEEPPEPPRRPPRRRF